MNNLYWSSLFRALIKRSLFIFVVCFSTIQTAHSQEIFGNNAKIIRDRKAEKVTVDHLGNLYAIEESVLYKYSLQGELLYSYSNFSSGPIRSVDVTNPMKIMVFYQDPPALIFLNDRLSPITEKLDLMDKGLLTVSAAAYSTRNQIWLYDAAAMDLSILDIYFTVTDKIHYHFPDFRPSQIIEVPGKTFAMHSPGQGVYFFDSFGTFVKTIAIDTEHDIQIVDPSIYYLKNDILHIYNYTELNEKQVPLERSDIIQCIVFRNRYILLTRAGEILIY